MTSAKDNGLFANVGVLRNLKSNTVRGGALVFLAQVAKSLIQLPATMILARLLAPSDFGLFSMAAAFTGFFTLLETAGLSTATVQQEEISHEQINALFWCNVAIGLSLVLMTASLAPAIALFYADSRLIPVTLCIVPAFFFSSLSVQHRALLRRRMRFTALSVIDIVSACVGVCIAICMAWFHCGYWSLVGMHVILPFSNSVMTWMLCNWRPGLPRRTAGVGSMLKFGGRFTAASLFDYVTRSVNDVVIGAVSGSRALGLYTKAYSLLLMPLNQVAGPIGWVGVPALSRLQSNSVRFRIYYIKFIAFSASVGMPMVAFAFVDCDKLIPLLLGLQWQESVPLFRALIPAAFCSTMQDAAIWLFVPLGRVDRQFKASFYGVILTVVAVVFGAKWGALGAAVAFSVSEMIRRPAEIIYACQDSPIKSVDFLGSIWRPGLASLVAAAALYYLRQNLLPESHALSILLDIPVFYMVYITVWMFVPGGQHILKETLRDSRVIWAADQSEATS